MCAPSVVLRPSTGGSTLVTLIVSMVERGDETIRYSHGGNDRLTSTVSPQQRRPSTSLPSRLPLHEPSNKARDSKVHNNNNNNSIVTSYSHSECTIYGTLSSRSDISTALFSLHCVLLAHRFVSQWTSFSIKSFPFLSLSSQSFASLSSIHLRFSNFFLSSSILSPLPVIHRPSHVFVLPLAAFHPLLIPHSLLPPRSLLFLSPILRPTSIENNPNAARIAYEGLSHFHRPIKVAKVVQIEAKTKEMEERDFLKIVQANLFAKIQERIINQLMSGI